VEEVCRLGTVLSAAMSVGIASRSLDVARDYALERQQFDVPIGSFQAVKHMLADMYVRSTLAQSAVYAAAALLDDPSGGDASAPLAGAKLLGSEAAISNASTAVQVLGGMGFTWDMLPNYLLKRAWTLELAFGTADDQALSIGSALMAAAR
jgi:alkylation response protein AidB-like acyl-CoA dehydrogenase